MTINTLNPALPTGILVAGQLPFSNGTNELGAIVTDEAVAPDLTIPLVHDDFHIAPTDKLMHPDGLVTPEKAILPYDRFGSFEHTYIAAKIKSMTKEVEICISLGDYTNLPQFGVNPS